MAHEAITLAFDLGKILWGVWQSWDVCKDLREQCVALLPVIQNPSVENNPAVDGLKCVLKECISYLNFCEEKKLKGLRHAAVEKLLKNKVPTFKERIRHFIITADLGVNVYSLRQVSCPLTVLGADFEYSPSD